MRHTTNMIRNDFMHAALASQGSAQGFFGPFAIASGNLLLSVFFGDVRLC
jgi:hypothetical protein